ncbi:MAG: hypothetical protein HDR25_04085 [Lachnospiraceae bacterium]|nr:hypothetical protein [Lachnospiraceae bacterium]
MAISAITGLSQLSKSYRISSIHGNPYSTYAIQKIGRNMNNQRGRALVIGQKEPKEDLYVKDYGELSKTTSTATGDFAEMLSMQKKKVADNGQSQEKDNNYASHLKDTIGVMGFQNGLREKLNNEGFALV